MMFLLLTPQQTFLNMESEHNRKPILSDSFGGTVEKDIPENVEWIDNAFYIKETRFGLYLSLIHI